MPCDAHILVPGTCEYLCMHPWLFSCVRLFETLGTAACQAPLSMGLFSQQYWSRLPFPAAGDHSNPGIKPGSPMSSALQTNSLPTEPL